MNIEYQAKKALWVLNLIWSPFTEPNSWASDEMLRFEALWLPKVELWVVMDFKERHHGIAAVRFKGDKRTGHLGYSGSTGLITMELWAVAGERRPDFEQFKETHLQQFRRNCWLSGCDVQATGHETFDWALELRENWPKGIPFFDSRVLFDSLKGAVLC